MTILIVAHSVSGGPAGEPGLRSVNGQSDTRGFPSCAVSSCRDVREGEAHGVNGDFDMSYIDVDKDP
ncbi:hypothetical protein ACWEGV_19100, partial [Streptomyces sp. NPDC004976]